MQAIVAKLAFLFLYLFSYNLWAMSCKEMHGTTGKTLPKSVSQKPKNYPPRNDGKAIQNFLVTESEPGYNPTEYVSPSVLKNSTAGGWAEAQDPREISNFFSYEGKVKIDSSGRPLNPKYRTGITNRGNLGKWGANFAGDALITRDASSTDNSETKKYEMLVIQRADTGEWAIPGGFVDAGEAAGQAILRELREETGIDLNRKTGKVIYRGYVDDPRNTDNAWIETTAMHWHIQGHLSPKAGDDAIALKWIELNEENLANMYASHGDIAKIAWRKLLQK